jgi:hypothetical protein
MQAAISGWFEKARVQYNRRYFAVGIDHSNGSTLKKRDWLTKHHFSHRKKKTSLKNGKTVKKSWVAFS